MTRARHPLFEVDRLSKLFPLPGPLFRGPRLLRAVDNVSLFVRHGETLAIIGESGAGKTVLAQTMLRLREPTYGRIRFEGRDLNRLAPRALRKLRSVVQMVFQDAHEGLDDRMTVGELLAEPMLAHGTSPSQAEARDHAALLLSRVELPIDTEGRRPRDLSTGERQRVGLARALATSPTLLVLDNPLSNVDGRLKERLVKYLTDQQVHHGVSFVLVSNDLELVKTMSHRVAVMLSGRFVELGTTQEILESPRHPYTRMWVDAASGSGDSTLASLALAPPPDPLALPLGCAFEPRCPRAMAEQCAHRVPGLELATSGGRHRVACFNPLP
jgi:oligopeptide/dipeptide ABC transporter ATP-binding protein